MKTIYDSTKPKSFALTEVNVDSDLSYKEIKKDLTQEGMDKLFCIQADRILKENKKMYAEWDDRTYVFTLTRTSKNRVVFDLYVQWEEFLGYDENDFEHFETIKTKMFQLTSSNPEEYLLELLTSCTNHPEYPLINDRNAPF